MSTYKYLSDENEHSHHDSLDIQCRKFTSASFQHAVISCVFLDFDFPFLLPLSCNYMDALWIEIKNRFHLACKKRILLMDKLANIFSVLHLDAEDDTEQTTTLVAAKDESNSSKSAKDGKKGESSGKDNSLKDGKKGESSGKENSLKNGRLNQESLASSSTDYKMPLVWIDLEMTGLDVTTDRILEIACVITDGKLTKSIEGPDFVISQTKECLDKMGEWCREHHAASGLTKRVLQSTISERDAEKQVIEFVKKHIGSDTPLLAGNSIYVDFLFLKKYMPDLAAIFPHVLVDVSSVMALCIRWFPRERKKAPQKEKRHRAMDDIKESISELKYYKESIFKTPKSK